VLDGSARFTPKLTLGYRDAVAPADSAPFAAGSRITGHEFHRTTVDFAGHYEPAWVYRGTGGGTVRDGAVHGAVHAAYLHTHPVAAPHAVRRFVAAAATSKLAG
jgi:cobyrinic acid a,c-diamide synthase